MRAFMDSDHFEESAFKRKGFLNAERESSAQQFQSVKAPQQLFCRELFEIERRPPDLGREVHVVLAMLHRPRRRSLGARARVRAKLQLPPAP